MQETGPTVYRPYPRRLECLTICICHYDEVLLTNRLICLRQCLVNGDFSVANSIFDIESHLKALHKKRIEGIIVRSRAEWNEEGECPS